MIFLNTCGKRKTEKIEKKLGDVHKRFHIEIDFVLAHHIEGGMSSLCFDGDLLFQTIVAST
jgi:hypothetical protein